MNKKIFMSLAFVFFINCIYARMLPISLTGRTPEYSYWHASVLYLVHGIPDGLEKGPAVNSQTEFGITTNFGLKEISFKAGIGASPFEGNIGIRKGFFQDTDIKISIDVNAAKFIDPGWSINTGPTINISLFNNSVDLVLSTQYIYTAADITPHNNAEYYDGYDNQTAYIPSGSSYYFYGGIEFDTPGTGNRLQIGGGYYHIPDSGLPVNYQVFSGPCIHIFGQYAFGLQKKIINIDDNPDNVEMVMLEAGDTKSIIKRARVLMEKRKYPEALLAISEGLSYDPDNYTLNKMAGTCHYKIGNKRKAYIYYKSAFRSNPQDVVLKSLLNELHTEVKNEKK